MTFRPRLPAPSETFASYPGTLVLGCVDCGGEFEFTPEERKFFAAKGFSEPRRCQACRRKRREEKETRRAPRPALPRATVGEVVSEHRGAEEHD